MPTSNDRSSDSNHPEPFGDHVYQPVQADERELATSTREANEHRPAMDPSIQRYLTKVQVLTPLAILLNLASLSVCSILIDPNIADVSAEHITQFTPNPAFILAYWATLFLFQVGFALLVVLGQKDVTKLTLVNGVGIRLALANILLGAWAITWVLNRQSSFIAGLVLLSVQGFVLLVTALILAIKYPPSSSRPLDWLFIHVPLKMFLVITIQLDIPQQLFIALGWDGEHHKSSLRAIWPSFGIFAGVGALSAIWIFATTDFVWAACSIVLHLAILFSKDLPIDKRRPEIIASIVLAMVLQAVAIIGSVLYASLSGLNADEGRIALGRNSQDEAAAARLEAEAEAAAATARARALAGHDSHEGTSDASHLEEGHSQGGNGVEVTRKLGST